MVLALRPVRTFLSGTGDRVQLDHLVAAVPATAPLDTAPRISLPPTTVAEQSEFGLVHGDVLPQSASQADAHASNPVAAQWQEQPESDGNDSDDFTDTSSDFSYGSSDGDSNDEDAEERRVLRQTRKALQVARKEARKESQRVSNQAPHSQ